MDIMQWNGPLDQYPNKLQSIVQPVVRENCSQSFTLKHVLQALIRDIGLFLLVSYRVRGFCLWCKFTFDCGFVNFIFHFHISPQLWQFPNADRN